MFRPATAPPSATPRPPAILRPVRLPARHRHQRYPLVRRDPRRFARGAARLHTSPKDHAQPPSDWRFFAHSFGGAFIFVSLFLA